MSHQQNAGLPWSCSFSPPQSKAGILYSELPLLTWTFFQATTNHWPKGTSQRTIYFLIYRKACKAIISCVALRLNYSNTRWMEIRISRVEVGGWGCMLCWEFIRAWLVAAIFVNYRGVREPGYVDGQSTLVSTEDVQIQVQWGAEPVAHSMKEQPWEKIPWLGYNPEQ